MKTRVFVSVFVGALLGILLLHPATMAIYWFEFRSDLTHSGTLGSFIAERMAASFQPAMLSMTGLFAALGSLVGVVYALIDTRFRNAERLISHLEAEMARDVPTLIELGESDRVEFKSTARWDLRTQKTNKALAEAVAKTIAAMANHDGGSLLIGVDDEGDTVGLEMDYRTLKSPDRDGFEQLIMSLVRERLGGHVCHLVHVLFVRLDEKDVCRVVVEPSKEPVFLGSGNKTRFFVRTGNASRELDARESFHYIGAHWGSARGG